jgi:osmotically-inducible protein OsmY
MLSGCLPAVFTAATGTTLALAKDRQIGESIDDAKISARIKASFIKNNFRELYTKINIEVVQGRVLYTGTVDKEEDITHAIQIAWDQPGVKEVINELKVDESSNHFDLVQYTKDTMITTQIKSKMLLHRDIKLVNYTIVTLNNIVYLFGIARSEEELEKVSDIAAKVHGVEKVVCHAKVSEQVEKIEDEK